MRRRHQVLHLHGFEHGDLLAGTDEITFPHLDRDDRALQRRRHRLRSRRTGHGFAGLGRNRFTGVLAGCEEQWPGDIAGCADQCCNMAVDEVGADAVGDEIGMRQHRLDKGDVGGDTADPKFTPPEACITDCSRALSPIPFRFVLLSLPPRNIDNGVTVANQA